MKMHNLIALMWCAISFCEAGIILLSNEQADFISFLIYMLTTCVVIVTYAGYYAGYYAVRSE
jgi:nitric oxide reductase large subunit